MRDPEHDSVSHARLYILGALMIGAMLLILARLWQVQLQHGSEHSRATMRQSVRPIRLNAIRGRMYAAGGEVLVDNRALFDAVYHLAEMRQPGKSSNTVRHILAQTRLLAARLGRPLRLTEEEIKRHLRVLPALPLTVFSGLTDREQAILAEMTPPLAGLEISTRAERQYPRPGVASHVLGHTGRQQPESTAEMSQYLRFYARPELRGWAGLERQYDAELAGVAGSRLVRVSALGYVHDEIGTAIPPQNGYDLVLTLDLRAQMAAERVLDAPEYQGALVLVEVNTGAVLAMASVPGFDLSRVDSAQRDSAYYSALLNDKERKPLLNRAMNTYTPGSILKPLVALAALDAGVLQPEAIYDCVGAYPLGPGSSVRCWNRTGHGPLDLVRGIEGSCNPYFIAAGMAAGLDRIGPMLAGAGIGVRPGLDLPPQQPERAEFGICPSREYLLERSHGRRKWIAADTAFLSIGQGVIGITPMHAALYTAAIANGGSVYRPFLVRSVRRADGREVRAAVPVIDSRLPVQAEHLALVRQGMVEVVNGVKGTGRNAHNSAISLAGKTGTAEVEAGEDRHHDTWFIGFGPLENPRYALAVLVEHGESGGRTAALLAGRFFEHWLGPGRPDAEPDAEPEGEPEGE
jgi:penicillin-binding protein 2